MTSYFSIELTDPDNAGMENTTHHKRTVFVAHIVYMERWTYDPHRTSVYLDGEDRLVYATESPEQILALIKTAEDGQ